MIISTTDSEARRTSPLAYWRYGHDYLRVARTLCRQHRIPCADAQVAYLAAAQCLEFSLKAFLRARGATVAALRTEIGRSLMKALARSEAQGLPPIPAPWRKSVAEIALCHQQTQFVYLITPEDARLVDRRGNFRARFHRARCRSTLCRSLRGQRDADRGDVHPPAACRLECDVRHRHGGERR